MPQYAPERLVYLWLGLEAQKYLYIAAKANIMFCVIQKHDNTQKWRKLALNIHDL